MILYDDFNQKYSNIEDEGEEIDTCLSDEEFKELDDESDNDESGDEIDQKNSQEEHIRYKLRKSSLFKWKIIHIVNPRLLDPGPEIKCVHGSLIGPGPQRTTEGLRYELF